jgi:hypothetical protein
MFHRQHLRHLGGDPAFLGQGLALRAMQIAAGVETHLVMAAGRALVALTAQFGGAAGHDGADCARLEAGESGC